jgi:predicted ATPase/5S rRNA maturation endonuclease (ribonuclease M5)
MELVGFKVENYKCILDSGWMEVSPLTVLVGKNESGKTSLLKALHKFNPYKPEPYNMDREWPRGYRKSRSDEQVVCTARFKLAADEVGELGQITDQQMTATTLDVTRNYRGQLDVVFPQGMFPDRVHPNEASEICDSLSMPTEPVSEPFRAAVNECNEEARRLAREGRFTDFVNLASTHDQRLRNTFSQSGDATISQNENNHVSNHSARLSEIANRLRQAPSIHKKAHEYVVKRIPTFIFMDEYKAFNGTAHLDQVHQRVIQRQPSEQDTTLLMIMELSGLSLASEVAKAREQDREQRQYDLDDAGATLTRDIEGRWKQRRYEVRFNADGNQFFTFVRDAKDPALIRLEERSKGFQWFFSFDLMLMYESKGTFKNCVILLDEPGLHLHPDAQRDLLRRLESYADGNTLIYSTHLPFMIDLRHPERVRVISETTEGAKVFEDLTSSQTEAKFPLQAALGMTGSSSFLLAERNLVVEGVDDYWFISELSNLFGRSGETALPEDVFVTAAGGASEAAYIATLMIGQDLKVSVLLDSDGAGEQARDRLVRNWLTKYKDRTAVVLELANVLELPGRSVAIEDLFPEDYYLDAVNNVYGKQLTLHGLTPIKLEGDGMLCKKVERFFAAASLPFNKGSVAKVIRKQLVAMKSADDLPQHTRDAARKLLNTITASFS